LGTPEHALDSSTWNMPRRREPVCGVSTMLPDTSFDGATCQVADATPAGNEELRHVAG